MLLRRYLLLLPALSLAWLCVESPSAFWREAYFVLLMMALTLATRTLAWRTVLLALSLGIGLSAPLMIGFGWILNLAGLDVSEGGIGNWGIVPIAEEIIKLAVVFLVSWRYQRATRLTFNPSDWLMAGCAVGAGFAMVENAELIARDSGVLRDMARQYGPSWLVPGAWGAAGYVGHAAATGFAAAGIGMATSTDRIARARGRSRSLVPFMLTAPFVWVTIEHVLANLHVDTGSRLTTLLGNGRFTPWLFLFVSGAIIFSDVVVGQRAIEHSSTLRRRRAVVLEALTGSTLPKRRTLFERVSAALAERRLVNAAAWVSLERLTPGGKLS